jgi:hypothetical protein
MGSRATFVPNACRRRCRNGARGAGSGEGDCLPADPAFTIKVYVQETKRRERLTEAERREYDRAVEWAEWAQMGTNDVLDVPAVAASENGSQRKSAAEAGSD